MNTEENKNEKLSTECYKGVRDFFPEDMAIQNYIFDTWRETAKKEGYEEYGASILEPAEIYRSKSGQEIVNEQMFTFTDRGDREVALRPEMTPTLARMVAGKRKSLKFPLRWFSIPNLFRYERPQRGRRREHWQLNCDLLGVGGIEGDIEIISLAHSVMKSFGAKDDDFLIKIGSRKALEDELSKRGMNDNKNRKEIAYLIDRKGKLPEEERMAKLKELGGDFEIEENEKTANIRKALSDKGIENTVFDPSIVRGFDYYTDMVFEVFDQSPENKRSLFGGGRYDNLLEIFDVEPVPAVGFGMGDITIRDFLETHGLKVKAN
ncbi:MAG: histidine--tRNA ligase [Parcubacteria group bacterium CG11_big_fil_rev_8_21_14_0_20_39_22]|nr:MAG: histidine--tRNA ligase [Parcubacteria group bacterium CG11_big_fil_rev_8_21_14_0_20_39_22]